jgi:hypothetical protein
MTINRPAIVTVQPSPVRAKGDQVAERRMIVIEIVVLHRTSPTHEIIVRLQNRERQRAG